MMLLLRVLALCDIVIENIPEEGDSELHAVEWNWNATLHLSALFILLLIEVYA